MTSATVATGFAPRVSNWAQRLVRGRADHAAWERPALLGLLAVTAVLYIWNLGANGWANSFYSAAVQAGSVNWTAFLFGSSDAANSITVDKPPASLWLMALSVRLFGLSSWSILLPEALIGVATVGVVWATVRRHFSAGAALVAGGVLALTPVATLMFRFNNPDALLVLLVTLSGYFTLRGVESGRIRWVIWAGVMVGFAFLTKQLQGFLVLPVLAAVYLWAAPLSFGRRMLHAFAALGAVIVSAGWWVAIVELVPASMRPFIGGSQGNDFLELTFGYNGFGRLTGNETGSVGGRGGWGATGILRLFESEIGGQISWLLPAALVLLSAATALLWRRPRVDPSRATLMLAGGIMLVTALAFSFMAGIFHAYYTLALAPAIAMVVGVGGSLVWERRERVWARVLVAATVMGSSVWAYFLLDRANWHTWLKVVVIVVGVAAGVLLLLPRRGRLLAGTTLAVTLLAMLLAPAAYSLDTATTVKTGSIVAAGPAVSGGMGGFGGRAGFGGGQPPASFALPNGARPPTGSTPPAGSAAHAGTVRGALGGLLGSATPSAQVLGVLEKDAGSYVWAAAAIGSNNASGYQLASGDPVMPIGGFNGTDPSPTLTEFQEYIADGDIHYFIASTGFGGGMGGSGDSNEIATWVNAHFTATTLDSVTLYDLTKPAS